MLKNPQAIIRATLLLLLSVVLIANILLPLEEDQRSSIACAEQGDYLGSFPGSIVKSYHLRGFGHKFLNYIIYKPLSAVLGLENKARFEIAFKVVTAIFYLILIALAVRIAGPFLRDHEVDPLVAWCLVSAAILTTSSEVHFQAEEISVALVLLGLSMSLSRSTMVQNLAGLPLALTFSMKGVTLALGCLALIARFAIDPQDRRAAIRLCVSFMLFSVAVIGGTLLFIPQEFRDLRDTAMIEGGHFSVGERIKNTWHAIRGSFDEIPIVISAFFAAVLAALALFSHKRYLQLFAFLLLWCAPIVPALIQGKGFIYHLAGFIVPSMITILGVYSYVCRQKLAPAWQWGACCVPIAACLLFTGPLPLFGGFNYVQVVRRANDERAVFEDWNQKYGLPKQPEILYLASGDVAYYARGKSTLRYFVPISIQRIERNPHLRDNPRFQEDMKTVMASSAPFVLLTQRWFEKPFLLLPELREKIDKEYTWVGTGGEWSLYQRK